MVIKSSFIKENWLLIFAVIYLISPIDLLPDFLPFLGKLDDTLVILIDLVKRYKDYREPMKRVDGKTFSDAK